MGRKKKLQAPSADGSTRSGTQPVVYTVYALVAAAVACVFALGGLGGPRIDAIEVLRELRRVMSTGDMSAADAFLRDSVGHEAFRAELSRTMSSRTAGTAEQSEAVLGMVMLTALSDSTGEADPDLYTSLARLDAEDSYSSRLGYEYGSGLRQRDAKLREPPSKQLAYQDAMKRLRPVPIGGWIGDAIDGANIGEPVHTTRGSVVTVYSHRPLIVAVDNFLSDSAAGAAVEAHDTAFDARIKAGETVCINDKTSASKLRIMTDQLAELAQKDSAPSSWRPQQRPGLICVPTTPSISEKFRRASTSINFEAGSSSVIDSIENDVATSIGLMDDPTEAAIERVAGSSTCSQLLRYYPPEMAPNWSLPPNPTFSYEDPADESDEQEDASTNAANSPTDSLDVSTAYELHTGE
eukprot:COSAG02_NODE_4980_length_4757_cov_3.290253_3_plen_409_part_00